MSLLFKVLDAFVVGAKAGAKDPVGWLGAAATGRPGAVGFRTTMTEAARRAGLATEELTDTMWRTTVTFHGGRYMVSVDDNDVLAVVGRYHFPCVTPEIRATVEALDRGAQDYFLKLHPVPGGGHCLGLGMAFDSPFDVPLDHQLARAVGTISAAEGVLERFRY